jgi:hypothetical protein
MVKCSSTCFAFSKQSELRALYHPMEEGERIPRHQICASPKSEVYCSLFEVSRVVKPKPLASLSEL